MKNVLLAALVIGLATTASGNVFAKTKAERQEAKAERQEKKAERQDRKAERKAEKVADADDHKGMGKYDKNHDGKMSFSEMKAKYDSRPAWSYRKDLVGMNVNTNVTPTMAAILSAVGGSGGGQSGQGGEHNGAASDR